MGVVTMSGGMILYTLGSRVVPSAELALLSNTEVLLAPFWVWLILGETASTGTFIGGAVVLVAILFNAYAGVRRMAPARSRRIWRPQRRQTEDALRKVAGPAPHASTP